MENLSTGTIGSESDKTEQPMLTGTFETNGKEYYRGAGGLAKMK